MLFDMVHKKTIFKQIWSLAFSYQDKRGDDGHAEIVTKYAYKLSKINKTNDDVVIPAAILHDVGWSQLPKEERFLIYNKNNSPELRFKVRYKHQSGGVKLVKKLLEKVNYPVEHVEQILDTISEHDTRKDCKTKEEDVVRDADKLSRVSKNGFFDDCRLSNITSEYYYDS